MRGNINEVGVSFDQRKQVEGDPGKEETPGTPMWSCRNESRRRTRLECTGPEERPGPGTPAETQIRNNHN